MFTDLARFGALMLVIILGFTVAFYAMFGSRSAPLPDGGDIAAYDTYYSSLLTLFGSMLGSFDFSVSVVIWREEDVPVHGPCRRGPLVPTAGHSVRKLCFA